MASDNCGTEALIFGSFIILASGVLASFPKSAKSSEILWPSFKNSGNVAIIRPAREMSLVSISIFAVLVNALTIGKKDWVANAGASSVLVYNIFAIGRINFSAANIRF